MTTPHFPEAQQLCDTFCLGDRDKCDELGHCARYAVYARTQNARAYRAGVAAARAIEAGANPADALADYPGRSDGGRNGPQDVPAAEADRIAEEQHKRHYGVSGQTHRIALDDGMVTEIDGGVPVVFGYESVTSGGLEWAPISRETALAHLAAWNLSIEKVVIVVHAVPAVPAADTETRRSSGG